MTRGHKGMRKGISLIEMLVAIVLFGIIGTISYTYYKNFYDTSFAAKQLRVYTIVDQAAQLSNAFDLYNTKYGKDINLTQGVQELVDSKLLTQIPQAIPAVTVTGWSYDNNYSVESATIGAGVVFTYAIDTNDTSSAQDRRDYCNILNNTAYSEENLTKLAADQNYTYELYREGNGTSAIALASETEFFHCAESNHTNKTANYTFVFVKRANQN